MIEQFDPQMWSKLVRYVTGESIAAEKKEIELWIAQDSSRKELVDELKETWRLSGKLPLDKNSDMAWQELNRRIQTRRPQLKMPTYAVFQTIPWRYPVRIAAVITLIIVSYGALRYSGVIGKPTQLSMREIVTGKGERVLVKFGDGTEVMLNSASVIRFPEKMADGVREVQLTGEAYFEVAHMDNLKFVVQTDLGAVEVRGTEFNVRSYADDDRMSVVVRGGKVAVQSRTEANTHIDAKVLLTSGEMSSVDRQGNVLQPRSVDVLKALAWINNRLVLDNTPFRDVLKELERRYNLDCSVGDSTILERHVKVSFSGENVTEILNVVSLSIDATYNRTGNFVRFYEGRSGRQARRK